MTNRDITYKHGAKTVDYCPRWHNHQHYVYCCGGRSCFGGCMAIAVPPGEWDSSKSVIDVVVCNWKEDEKE